MMDSCPHCGHALQARSVFGKRKGFTVRKSYEPASVFYYATPAQAVAQVCDGDGNEITRVTEPFGKRATAEARMNVTEAMAHRLANKLGLDPVNCHYDADAAEEASILESI